MALSDNKVRKTRETEKITNRSFAVASNQTLYEGALIAIDSSGNAIEASTTTTFVGIANQKAENATTAIDTDTRVVVQTGQIERLTSPATASAGYIGLTVYASADDTIATTGSAKHAVGTVVGFDTDGYLYVRIAE